MPSATKSSGSDPDKLAAHGSAPRRRMVSDVLESIGPCISTVAMSFAVLPLANVLPSINIAHLTVTMPFTLLECANVSTQTDIGGCAFPIRFAILPLANVLIPITPCV